MPPARREKARFMNVDVFVRWGQKTLAYLESSASATLDDPKRKVLQTKLGWLRDFGEELSQWGAMVQRIDECFTRFATTATMPSRRRDLGPFGRRFPRRRPAVACRRNC